MPSFLQEKIWETKHPVIGLKHVREYVSAQVLVDCGEDDDEDEALEPQVASEALEDVFPSQRRKGNPRKGVKEEKTLSCKLCNYAVARAYSPNALHQARLVFLNYLSLFFYSEQSHNHFQWAGMQAKVSLQMWGKLSRR